MTNDEIIVELEKLLRIGDSPIGKGFGVIIDKGLLQEIVDLINELRADLKSADEHIEYWMNKVLMQKAEIERLTKNLRDFHMSEAII